MLAGSKEYTFSLGESLDAMSLFNLFLARQKGEVEGVVNGESSTYVFASKKEPYCYPFSQRIK